MQLPFTEDQFFSVFKAYNESVWPVQMALLGLAVTALCCVFLKGRKADAAIAAILAFLWLWLGAVYHLTFFYPLNTAAMAFGALSITGSMIFVWSGVLYPELRFRPVRGIRAYVGLAFILFSLVVYPAASIYAGHSFPEMPTFGLPCPTAIFTIGVLSFLEPPYPRLPILVPVIWSFVGLQAAFFLGVPQDTALLPAGAWGIWLAVRNSE
ncbi:MAG: hypothetical protein IPM63_18675 [Acidobacteriota bacterium]|nr:MAG: hypothetical protein IPM63_18675 [Acidobacteriota bacterium]